MRTLAVLAAILVAAPAAASLQTDYSAAQAALDAGQWSDARDRFAGLLGRLPASQAHTAALLGARLGVAELRLGNADAAIARLRAALPVLTRPEDAAERILIGQELGTAYEDVADLKEAARAYQTAMAEPTFATDSQNINVRIGLVRALVFADPSRARAEFESLLPLVVPQLKKTPMQLAAFYDLRGRIELNDQKFDAARTWFEKALPLAGGLSEKVTLFGQRIRGNLAIAALLGGHADDGRRYLAYTGAGYLPVEALSFRSTIAPPACAPLTDLRPDDVAVIEIRIGDDGRVENAKTIYASRMGGPDRDFAAAAREWRWDREALAKLKPFWREALRLEIRCNTTRDGPELGLGLFDREVEAWYAAARIEPLPDLPADELKGRAALVAEIERRTSLYGPTSPQLFPTMFNLPATIAGSDKAMSDRLIALAVAGHAPRNIVLALASGAGHRSGETDMGTARSAAAAITRAIAEAAEPGDAGSRGFAFLHARLGIERERLKDDDGAAAAYRSVIAAPLTSVSAADPIRQVALLRLASIEAARKNMTEASALFRQTGLSADQCSLVDVKPLPTRLSVGEHDFPTEALAWRFEGMVRVGYDIDTTGKPVGIRTIIASPPFAFSKGTEQTAARFRYRPIFREGSGIGCSGYSTVVRYQIR